MVEAHAIMAAHKLAFLTHFQIPFPFPFTFLILNSLCASKCLPLLYQSTSSGLNVVPNQEGIHPCFRLPSFCIFCRCNATADMKRINNVSVLLHRCLGQLRVCARCKALVTLLWEAPSAAARRRTIVNRTEREENKHPCR